MIVVGIQAVTEALRSSRSRVERVWVVKGGRGKRLQTVIDLARSLQVPVQFEPRPDNLSTGQDRQATQSGGETGRDRHGTPRSCDGLESTAAGDGVEDPRNWERCCAQPRPPAGRSRDPRAEVMRPLFNGRGDQCRCRPSPPGRSGDQFGESPGQAQTGWILGAGLDLQGKENLDQIDLTERLVVVVGSENRGLRPAVRGSCDFLVALPMRGQVQSLNLSVAAAVVLYQIVFARSE